MTRREFFSAGAVVLAAGAFAFGQEIDAHAEGKSGRTAILYGTRYGATRDTAGWIAQGMGGGVTLLDIETVNPLELVGAYDRFVIGSGIWIDGPHKKLLKLLRERSASLSPKVAASFVVCGSSARNEAGRKRIAAYLERLNAPLVKTPKLQQAFGGRMVIAELTETDRKLLKNFYENIVKKPFADWDRTDPKGARSFGKEI